MATQQGNVGQAIGAVSRWFTRNLPALIVLVILLLLWEAIAIITPRGNAYFPSLGYIAAETQEHSGAIWEGFQTTGTEVVVGFVIAIFVGISFGLIVTEIYTIRHMTLPYVLFFHSIPTAILAPIFLGVFGNEITGVIAFVIWAGFLPVFLNTVTGLTQIRSEFYLLADITGATKWQRIRYIKFWSALPNITSAFKVAATVGVIVAIVAEFIATSGGLGHLIIESMIFARVGLMFGTVFIISVLGVIWFNLIAGLIYLLNPVTAG